MFWSFTLSIKVASRIAQKPRNCGSSLGQVHTSCQSACPEFRTAKSPSIMCVQCIRGCSAVVPTRQPQLLRSWNRSVWPFSLGKLGTSVEESTVHQGSVKYIGGYDEYIGGYHEYIGRCSAHRGISWVYQGFQYKSKAFINLLPLHKS